MKAKRLSGDEEIRRMQRIQTAVSIAMGLSAFGTLVIATMAAVREHREWKRKQQEQGGNQA